ncbi:srs domain-containing protein [Cystoisospora suis]|uniref:Srs domain-containing protein n=1 Tax=Cystoisospora suis TaxID=483139 RepID=A0A2C6L958_9APIC|nr:srs domain-containing protein [Cystoisospora suis]
MSRAEGETLRVRQGVKPHGPSGSALRKAIPVLVVAVVVSMSFRALPTAANADEASSQNQATSKVESQVATCTKPSTETSPVILSAAISEAENTLTLACTGYTAGAAVPSTLTDGTVCASTPANTLASCEESVKQKKEPATVKVKDLLGSETNIVWAPAEANGKKTYSLEIGKKDFPYLDKTFLVGCMENSTKNFECRVNVTVKARASTVSGQVATCAYGESSNPSVLEITMTQEKNSFALVCGNDGTSVPGESTFNTEFCPGSDVTKCQTTVAYGSILPAFTSEWWTTGAEGGQHVLTIPPENFPEKEQFFLVGCVPAAKAESKSQTSACNVKVTVRPKQNGSGAFEISYATISFYVAVSLGAFSSLV